MGDDAYRKLAKVLDTLPNGFPATESGLEIDILKKTFTEKEAEMFCDLRLSFETADQIAERTGRPLEGLEDFLDAMWERGLVFGVNMGGVKIFKMMPWVFGVYELQLERMDREFAEMCEKYFKAFGKQFFENKPQLMQVLPVEKEISAIQETLPYEKVSGIIENGQSFGLAECICKKEKRLLDDGCDKPSEVCMAIAPVPGIFENSHWGRPISKEKAREVLKKSEEAGLVHMTSNVESGHFYICNCCGCCCGVLRAINNLGIADAVNTHFFAEIDPDSCVACGVCADERCQVNAIEEDGDVYRVIRESCIGCGLCVSTCPEEAVSMKRKADTEIVAPPGDEDQWFESRGESRGVDYSAYK
ncbi:4Fe-4S ferredoxin iron-sulfur binding domain-containing protein [Candidatus Desulfarcum epimagneticum]|uniref:4Fe-4S ferredoxin iron-sulfur binding domain-containing protein n=1 Tax=uncultured Desulfobacteraceae bacterium TaxID=218296 RepID=A0A484HJT3_9BACT|nr:4Fe-4S ferredoxin iron-sulfur binding domain-containing protein [uncultured Desulfobacteraceae bacterium]